MVIFAGNLTKLEETCIKTTALKCTPHDITNEQIAEKCSKIGGSRVERKKLWAGKKVNELQSRGQ